MSFAHLHVHSHYSLLQGLGSPLRYVKTAKNLGQSSLAITDHGNLYGAIEFYKAAKHHDLHAVIGVECAMAVGKRTERRPKIDTKTHQLILLAENKKGYENLLQIVTKSYLEGFYFRPRIDWELLETYREGLIVLTSGLSGLISHFLLSGMHEEARSHLKRLQDLFGRENVFIELQDHPALENQAAVNTMLIETAKSLGTPLVATHDVHYPTQDDREAQDVLLCIKDNRLMSDAHRFRLTDDFSMQTEEQMKARFPNLPEAISNTEEIAKRCKVQFNFGKNLIPSFKTPKNQSAVEFLRHLVAEGLVERYHLQASIQDIFDSRMEHLKGEEKSLVERMNYELTTISKMGFDEYFLIIWDLIRYAREQGIFVGPGRGSAAGAIIAYCLKITDLNPLQYDLLFERFLNPARVSMPDIDIDFEDERRDEVLEYVKQKYGRENVAQVITFGTLAAKASVKDVGRVQGIPFQEMNRLTKLIPSRPGTKLKEALEEESELKEEYEKNEQFKKIYNTALKLEGTVRQAGVHACAVIISKDQLTRHCPLQKAPGDDDSIITQYSMKPLEDLGLLKMDFLGLRNLTILRLAKKIIERRTGRKINLSQLPMDDQKTFELLSEGKTTGVFQLESSGMKRYLKDLKPSTFEDIIAMGALYRPGPMQFIPDYIAGKHGQRKVKYVHEDLKPILEKTYGIAVYQEQILQIAQKFAGFSLGQADLLRRAIGKKIASELKAQREKFIQGGVQQGYREELATEIFDKVIEPFANYGFNKSHAACYAMISYQTAYLKAHYPAEFMASLLTCDQENIDRVVIDIGECELMGLKVLPPEVNQSFEGFTVIDEKTIRYGLSAIKNLGQDTITEILKARKDSPFSNLGNFLERVPQKCVNKKSLEALIMSGALDAFGDRNALMRSVERLIAYAKENAKGQVVNQTHLFEMLEEHGEHHPLELEKSEVASWFQKLKWEKEALGIYVSDHPLHGLREYMKRKVTLMGSLKASQEGNEMEIGGLVNSVRKMTTKKGESMAVLELEDLSGKIPVVIFPRVYEKIKDSDILSNDEYFLMARGKVSYRGGELQLIAMSLKKASIQSMRENAQEQGLFNPKESTFFREEVAAPEDFEDNEMPIPHALRFSLHDRVEVADLKKIKTMLMNYPGEKPVTLNVVIEGRRREIPTGIFSGDHEELREKIKPYLLA